MFIDASALVAILLEEDGFEALATIIDESDANITSAIAIWETSARLLALLRLPAGEVEQIINAYLEIGDIRLIPIGAEESKWALHAFDHYGKGRHPAALNMGDCFAYGCARAHDVALLYVGNDFSRTDMKAAMHSN